MLPNPRRSWAPAFELGEQVASVEEAEEQVGFIVQVPEALGEPGAIYVRRVSGVPEVDMVWPAGAGPAAHLADRRRRAAHAACAATSSPACWARR